VAAAASNAGAIVGGVLGSLAFVLALLCLVLALRRRRRRAASHDVAKHGMDGNGGHDGGAMDGFGHQEPPSPIAKPPAAPAHIARHFDTSCNVSVYFCYARGECDAEAACVHEATRARFADKALFLDVADSGDLDAVAENVSQARNVLVFLSRGLFASPRRILELCVAVRFDAHVFLVRPARAAGDGAFDFGALRVLVEDGEAYVSSLLTEADWERLRAQRVTAHTVMAALEAIMGKPQLPLHARGDDVRASELVAVWECLFPFEMVEDSLAVV